MADATKQVPINGGTLISDLKSLFSLFRTKRTKAFAYAFMFAFIVFTIFLVFNPSPNSASPWFSNIFASSSSSSTSTSTTAISSNESNRSQFSSNLFPNSSQTHNSTSFILPTNITRSQNTTFESPKMSKQPSLLKNHTQNKELHDRIEAIKPNQSTIEAPKSPAETNRSANSAPKSSAGGKNISGNVDKRIADKGLSSNLTSSSKKQSNGTNPNQRTMEAPKSPAVTNLTANSSPKTSPDGKNITRNGDNRIAEKGMSSNLTSPFLKKQSNGTNPALSAKQRSENLVKSLMNCDLFDGEWVRDDSYPLYKPGSCSLIDEQFNCFLNGRPDKGYQKFKWKPKGCTLPRLDGNHVLEMLRGKRLVFVGDSLNRNMWESLVCILRNTVKDQTKVYEVSGRHHFRTEASYSFVFKDYGCTVEFFVSPFLVQEWEMPEKNGSKKETLRLDIIEHSAEKYKSADIIIFNTGHWWTHDKTSKGKDYYQEGSHVYGELNVIEAFRKALTTWARWVDANINPMRTLVFFRGYSASHFRGGQWNSGGQCNSEIEPIINKTYLSDYPPKMTVLESVLKGMKTRVSYLNITRLTDYRKDGHPSIFRKQHFSEEERRSPLRFQDCSHWCLPGVPDAWNELLYAELLIKQYQKQQQKRP